MLGEGGGRAVVVRGACVGGRRRETGGSEGCMCWGKEEGDW